MLRPPRFRSRKRSRCRHPEAGATLVEYAFIFLIFMSLIFGIMAFGHALFTYHHLNNVAKEATRYAAVRGYTCANDLDGGSCQANNSASGISGPTTLADVQTFVQTITPPSIDSSLLTISACGVSGQSACSASGPQICTVAVAGSGPYANYPGCMASVTVSYPYTFMFPLLPVTTTTTSPCTSAGFCISSTSELIIVH